MVPTVMYADKSFARVCPECGAFVKADDRLDFAHNTFTEEDRFDTPNATCHRHGRVLMPFLGYFGGDEA